MDPFLASGIVSGLGTLIGGLFGGGESDEMKQYKKGLNQEQTRANAYNASSYSPDQFNSMISNTILSRLGNIGGGGNDALAQIIANMGMTQDRRIGQGMTEDYLDRYGKLAYNAEEERSSTAGAMGGLFGNLLGGVGSQLGLFGQGGISGLLGGGQTPGGNILSMLGLDKMLGNTMPRVG